MKWLCVLFPVFALSAILFSGNLAAWQQQAPAKDKESHRSSISQTWLPVSARQL